MADWTKPKVLPRRSGRKPSSGIPQPRLHHGNGRRARGAERKDAQHQGKMRVATRRKRSRKLSEMSDKLNSMIHNRSNITSQGNCDSFGRMDVPQSVNHQTQTIQTHTYRSLLPMEEGVKEKQVFMAAGLGKGRCRLSITRESRGAMEKELFKKQGAPFITKT